MRQGERFAGSEQNANRQSAIVVAVAEGFEPSRGRINSAVPYQLGYATGKREGETRGDGDRVIVSASPYHPISASHHWRR